jgi:hypothetical protein
MSRNQRIMLVVAALAVAVIAFVIASPGSDEESGEQAAQRTTQTETERPEAEPEAETRTEAESPPEPPPKPPVTRIRIKDGQVVGGSRTVETAQGDKVRIVISSDAGDELHLHGYDITKNSGPGEKAVFDFKANLEGVFELESHVAEDAGQNPLVAKLVVNPS